MGHFVGLVEYVLCFLAAVFVLRIWDRCERQRESISFYTYTYVSSVW